MHDHLRDVRHRIRTQIEKQERFFHGSMMIRNFFLNCHMTEIDLTATLLSIIDIQLKNKTDRIEIDDQEKKILSLFPDIKPAFPDELLPNLIKSSYLRDEGQPSNLDFTKICLFVILASKADTDEKLDMLCYLIKT